ncbi:MAG: hypothetical protein U0R19_32460 [Bryobacteraceae bacterium]
MQDLLPGFTVKAAQLLFAVLSATVFLQFLTGRIRMRGMLLDTDGKGHSPARLQMLVFTLFGAMQYLTMAVKDPTRLPEPSPEMLTLLGGSHALFMGSKVVPLFVSILSERMQKR